MILPLLGIQSKSLFLTLVGLSEDVCGLGVQRIHRLFVEAHTTAVCDKSLFCIVETFSDIIDGHGAAFAVGAIWRPGRRDAAAAGRIQSVPLKTLHFFTFSQSPHIQVPKQRLRHNCLEILTGRPRKRPSY